jgi:pyrroline-5-carboxylate reductase
VTRPVGFIGTGHFTRFLVEGLHREGNATPIVVSPRNAARARDLADRFGAVVAADNQGVVDAADVVVVATRPGDWADALAALDWRAGQTAVTVVGGLALAPFARAVAPATAVKAMVSYAVAVGESPFFLYPDDVAARAFGARLGAVMAFEDEAGFEVASVMPVFHAMVFRLLATGEAWCADQGIAPEVARALTTLSLRGASVMVARREGESLEGIVESLAPPGGLTEGGLGDLEAADAFGAWRHAMDGVLARARH